MDNHWCIECQTSFTKDVPRRYCDICGKHFYGTWREHRHTFMHKRIFGFFIIWRKVAI